MRVGDRLSIDLTLQVGALTEEITVSGAPLLETSNAMRGQVIASAQVAGSAAARSQSVLLAQLSPGVQYTPARPAGRTGRSTTAAWTTSRSAADAHSRTSSCSTACPTPATETTQPNNLSFVPSPDATAEFSVQTSIYDAQYGRTGGGVVNVVREERHERSSTARSISTTATKR